MKERSTNSGDHNNGIKKSAGKSPLFVGDVLGAVPALFLHLLKQVSLEHLEHFIPSIELHSVLRF